jgi:hypothetical protein
MNPDLNYTIAKAIQADRRREAEEARRRRRSNKTSETPAVSRPKPVPYPGTRLTGTCPAEGR